MLKKITALALLLPFLAIAGCNTVQGMGEDVSAGGRGIQKAATGASNSM